MRVSSKAIPKKVNNSLFAMSVAAKLGDRDDSMRKILIVGFGTVGQGFFELFDEKRPQIQDLESVKVSEIVDMKLGYVKDPPSDIIRRVKGGKSLPEKGRDVLDTIRNSDADIVCEFTWVNMKDGEPAFSHIKEALKLGKHVITTNKGPIALRFNELENITRRKDGPSLKFKGTVMAGTPSYNLLDLLPGIQVSNIRGILNGTSNFILTEMGKGKSFDESLKEAQSLGYAEADPIMDVDGFDAALKTMILSNVVGWRDERHSLEGMEIKGIRDLQMDESPDGRRKKTKLLVTINKNSASVKPTVLEERRLAFKRGWSFERARTRNGHFGKDLLYRSWCGKEANGPGRNDRLARYHKDERG